MFRNKKLALRSLYSSKLALTVLLITLLTLGLSGWGLALNRSSIKEVANAVAASALKNSQSAAKTSLQSTSQATSSPTSTSTTPKTSTNTSAPKTSTTSGPTPSSTVSDADKARANSDIQAIHSDLETYYISNGYYPSDISYSNFSSFGADPSVFNPPTGVHFVYSPSPSGCTTAAQNCMHYTLDALDSNNNPVAPQQKSAY